MEESKRIRVAGIILDKDGRKILLMHRVKDGKEYYVIPGGGVESGEDLESALSREIKEETNLDISDFVTFYRIESDTSEENFFLIKKYSGDIRIGGPEEERQSKDNFYKLEWVSLDNIKNLDILPQIKMEIIKKFR